MSPKVFTIRSIRKASHLSSKVLSRSLSFSTRVEDKATRILTGVDFSVSAFKDIPFEQAFFNGIQHNVAPLNPALPAVGRKGKVTLLIPSLRKSSFFGGTATALILAGNLALKTSKELRIVETLEPGGKEGLGDFFAQEGINISESQVELIDVSARGFDRYGYIDLHPDDTFIASAWWDAYVLDKLPLTSKYIYLIQDFEPIFYSNSDEYVMAENTYRSERFIPVCNTKLMYDYMAARYPYIKKSALYFEPAMSQAKTGFVAEKKPGEMRRIFLYGRPNVKRNLFFSALNSLNDSFTSGALNPADWEIFMAGQDKLPNITLSSGIVVQNLGKMPIGQYYEFSKTIDVALSLMMAPHPNYPTLEFASIGSAVVTTKYEDKIDLSRYSANIFMADLTIASLSETLIAAANLPFETRLANAKRSKIGGSWQEVLEPALDSLSVPVNVA